MVQKLGQILAMDSKGVEAMLRAASSTGGRESRANSGGRDASGDISAENLPSGVVSDHSEPKMKAKLAAQRRVIGCLLRKPELFHCTLSDGSTVDEALTPDAITAPGLRRLYEFLYDRLTAGRSERLTGLLADLAAQGQEGLADLATGLELELTDYTHEQLEMLICREAPLVLEDRSEPQYQEARQRMLEDTSASGSDALWLEVLEHQKVRQSPARMADVDRLGL